MRTKLHPIALALALAATPALADQHEKNIRRLLGSAGDALG